MSITPYGEASVPKWAQSAFKDISRRIAPQGARQYEAEQYYEEDQSFDAKTAFDIEQENAKRYKELLLNKTPMVYIVYQRVENNDQQLISEFIATAQREIFKTAHGVVTHYIRG